MVSGEKNEKLRKKAEEILDSKLNLIKQNS